MTPMPQLKSKPVIQVVEDDAAVRASLVFLLESCGFGVHCYGSAEELLADNNTLVDCLLLDYHLPGMTGVDLVDRLHARKSSPPIVMITGRIDAAIRRQAADSGAQSVIEKPFEDETLLDAIARAMG